MGYGFNLDAGMSRDEAELLMNHRIQCAMRDVTDLFTADEIESMGFARFEALTEMVYNLGIGGFRTFRNMIGAIRRQDWPKAADEALDSRWARQVGRRADRIAKVLLTG